MGGPRAWASEFLGTLMFVTVGAGSVIVTNGQIAPLGVFGVAAAHGLVLAVAMTTFGGVSGGHFNPAVTLSMWVGGRIRANDAAAYLLAQISGAVAAGGLLLAMLGETGRGTNLGTPGPRAGYASGRVILIEAAFTFFVVLVYWGTMADDRGHSVGGFGAGMMFFAAMLVSAQLTGGVLNPVRHMGTGTVSGVMQNWWIYWVGPGIGGLLAGVVYPTLLLDRRFPWRLVPAAAETSPRRARRKATAGE